MRRSLLVVLAIIGLSSFGHAYVIDFEDMVAPPSTFNVGDMFVTGGVTVTCQDFTWSNDIVYSGGTATLQSNGDAGATGNEIWTNNINLHFDFSALPVHGLSFQFGDFGGNENLTINDEFKNVNSLTELHGLTVGGAMITVIQTANGQGALFATGEIESFAVGGQEFAIDNVIACIPEPASMALLGLGALLLRRRR